MSPLVLSRVISGQKTLKPDHPITIHAAKLSDHRRHKLKDLDYPGVVASRGHDVIGTVAYGISDEELERLDIFEGDEYIRKNLSIVDQQTQETVLAGVYIWIADTNILLNEDWDLQHFQNHRESSWIGEELQALEADKLGGRFWDHSQVSK